MKKLLLIVTLLALTVSFGFAQANVSGWGRGILTPLITDFSTAAMDLNTSWGYGPRIGFSISGSSDNVGAQVDVNYEGTGAAATWDPTVTNYMPSLGDQQKIWVKPAEMLTISVGTSCWDDTFRGNAGFVLNNWLRSGSLAGDDYTFRHVVANAIVAVDPAAGFHAYVAMAGLKESRMAYSAVLDNIIVGAGYDIAGIGVIRAQYTGSSQEINAAFKVTAVEGLMVDLGVFYPNGGDLKVALYGNYVMNTMTVHLAVDATLATDLVLNAGLGVEYGLEAGPTIQGDVRMFYNAANADPITLAGGLFSKWSYSNGVFGIGVEVTTADFAGSSAGIGAGTLGLAIPIRCEYWF
jgi:hypothetical protein